MTHRIVVFGAFIGLLGATDLRAADHRDGPAALADPSTDINDLFAWISADGAQVYLAMTVFPAADKNAKFSNAAKYVFHTNSKPSYVNTTATNQNIICTFDTAQTVSCWAGDSYVSGDAHDHAGITSMDGKLRVFTGPRKDPFFFNLDGFKAVVKAVHSAGMGGLTLDSSGCPQLPQATAAAWAGGLAHAPNANMMPTTTLAPVDFFKTLNTLAIVIAVDKSIVTKGGPVVGVWASTNK
jgi:hypothetical protein